MLGGANWWEKRSSSVVVLFLAIWLQTSKLNDIFMGIMMNTNVVEDERGVKGHNSFGKAGILNSANVTFGVAKSSEMMK